MKGYFLILAALNFFGCSAQEEVSLEDVAQFQNNPELEGTVYKPGGGEWEIGRYGGTWTASINNDPKSFNTLNARDGDTGKITSLLYDTIIDYNPYTREFEPNLASFVVEADEEKDKLSVVYTLRDDLYWTLPGQSQEQGVKVTSDDVIFWYDEVEGDVSLQQPGYSGRFIAMPDGSEKAITIEKIDEKTFRMVFPRIIANPLLYGWTEFGPKHIFEPVKRSLGATAMLDLQSIDTDPQLLPSIGAFHIISYEPGVRVVAQKNPNYWKKDKEGNRLPYIDRIIYRIIPDTQTELLVFLQGEKDAFSLRPEDLAQLKDIENKDFTIYFGNRSLGSALVAFNQHPTNMDPVVYSWMKRIKFRQALSCLLNRERIAQQAFRGLAVPAHHFFAVANPMFDPDITLPYTYNPERALALLAEEGFLRGEDGTMLDPEGRPVVFDIIVGSEYNVGVDMMNIFSDELKQIGINGRVRPIDFQKLVEQLTKTFDWHLVTVALGSNYWPEGGPNVWLSSGNFHLWHPLQEEPATEWETRLDELFNQGRYTLDQTKRKLIYDEYQKLILEQVPLTYTVHPLSLIAVRNIWGNVVHDNLGGLNLLYLFQKE